MTIKTLLRKRKLIVSFVSTVVVLLTSYVAVTSQPQEPFYKVAKVVDGDTIDVEKAGKVERVRLLGINTPEISDPRKPVECFAKEASDKAKEILSGKRVGLEADPSQSDKDTYGRLLRYVFLEDGTSFDRFMISEGYAFEYTYKGSPYKYQDEFKDAQREAMELDKGLWSSSTCSGEKKL